MSMEDQLQCVRDALDLDAISENGLAGRHSCGEWADECMDGFCIYGVNPCATHDLPLEEAIEWSESRSFPTPVYTADMLETNPNITMEQIGCVIGCEYKEKKKVVELTVEIEQPPEDIQAIVEKLAYDQVALEDYEEESLYKFFEDQYGEFQTALCKKFGYWR